MKKNSISLIAALSENRVIGNKGKIPWHIPEDLKRFKKLTLGHAIIMGRKTYASIGKPLPNRTNIIITRDPHFLAQNCTVVHSLKEAIDEAKRVSPGEIFIIGGGEIFAQALPFADKLYLTVVTGQFEGDAIFPDYSLFKTIINKQDGLSGEYKYVFLDLKK